MIRRVLLMLLLAIYATTPAVAAACAAACAVPAIGAEATDCHGTGLLQPDDAAQTHSDADESSEDSPASDSLMLAACAFAASAALTQLPVEMNAAPHGERMAGVANALFSLFDSPPGEPPRG